MECPYNCLSNCSSYYELKRHIRLYHQSEDSNVQIICKMQNCFREFSKINSFYKHFRKKHTFDTSPKASLKTDGEDEYDFLSDGGVIYESNTREPNFEQAITDGNLKFDIDTFLNTLYKKVHITNVDIDDIIKSVKQISPELENVATVHKRINYFKKKKVYVKPTNKVMGVTAKGFPDSITCISLIDTMKKIFSDNNFFELCKNYMSSQLEDPTILTDFKDGSTFQTSVQTNQLTLPFVLYYDDFESGNPLGSKRGIHKIGAVYMALRCCYPFFYSKLENIHLVMLMKTKQRETYRNSEIFKDLCTEINFLENEGILVSGELVKFKFIGFAGDNLGLHSLLGITESFSAEFSCRFCKIKKCKLHKSFKLEHTLLRTPENYMVGHDGVTSECAFHQIQSFHCCTNYVVDIMHDLFHGVATYVLTKVLKYYVQNKFFSVTELNERMRSVNFSSVDKTNRPPDIKHNNILKESMPWSASEVKNFLMYIPVMIGDLIPRSCEYWRLILLLHDIACICLCKKICHFTLNYLDTVVSEHNELYCKLFKDNLKPKFHYLMHYSSIIMKSGPMSHLWSFRFESKHQVLKEYTNVCKCRKDICLSIAKRMQQMMAASLICSVKTKLSPSLSKETGDNTYEMLEYRGVLLKRGNFIQLFFRNNYPVFGEVSNFLFHESKVNIRTVLYKTLGYDAHLHSYLIECSDIPFEFELASSMKGPVMKFSMENKDYIIDNRFEI